MRERGKFVNGKLLFTSYRLDGKQDEVDCAGVSSVGTGSGEPGASVTPAAPIVQNLGTLSPFFTIEYFHFIFLVSFEIFYYIFYEKASSSRGIEPEVSDSRLKIDGFLQK